VRPAGSRRLLPLPCAARGTAEPRNRGTAEPWAADPSGRRPSIGWNTGDGAALARPCWVGHGWERGGNKSRPRMASRGRSCHLERFVCAGNSGWEQGSRRGRATAYGTEGQRFESSRARSSEMALASQIWLSHRYSEPSFGWERVGTGRVSRGDTATPIEPRLSRTRSGRLRERDRAPVVSRAIGRRDDVDGVLVSRRSVLGVGIRQNLPLAARLYPDTQEHRHGSTTPNRCSRN